MMGESRPDSILPLSDLTPNRIGKLNNKIFSVAAKGFEYPVRLRLEPGADRLFIMLHGAIDRSKQPLPAFARWNWGKILGGHVLAVCDPTLYQHPDVEIGWFVGSKVQHAIPGLVAITAQVQEALRVPEGNAIYYGSSGGGYSAILAASRMGAHGRAIAINPQIEIRKYHLRHVSALAHALGNSEGPCDLDTLPPASTSAIHAYRAALDINKAPSLLIAQNTADKFHLRNHYSAFVNAFGLSPEGGFDNERRIGSILFRDPGGHSSGESKELVNQIRTEGIPFLLAKKACPWWKFW